MKYWPTNCPDLSPIEHLWGALKRILKGQKFTSKNQLIEKMNCGKVFLKKSSIA